MIPAHYHEEGLNLIAHSGENSGCLWSFQPMVFNLESMCYFQFAKMSFAAQSMVMSKIC